MSTSPLLKTGARSDDVKVLQALLNQVVVPSPGIGVDGDFGAHTTAAVVAFQKSEQLQADGVVDDLTWAHLHARADAAPVEAPPVTPGTPDTPAASGPGKRITSSRIT